MRKKAASLVLDNVPVNNPESLKQVTAAMSSIFKDPNEIDPDIQEKMMESTDNYLDIVDNIDSEEGMKAALGGVLNVMSKVGEASANTLDVTSNSSNSANLKDKVGSSPEALEKVIFLFSSLIYYSRNVKRPRDKSFSFVKI